ncbi:hypothetical protein GCM10009332_06920 [Shewanella gelidii]|uniref:Tetratricopeptide repeat protein n=2 Tax=Shewanella gelidii TaxID=1642821 RepID=A0A917JJ13_9GAMM|nr:hypothetical protein GCM10009332_06920 [Shewanella gelidii]
MLAEAKPNSYQGQYSMSIQSNLANAEALYRQAKYSESLELCNKVLAKKPKLAHAIHIVALNNYAQGEFETAIIAFKKAIAINDQQSSFHSNLGNIYLDQEDFSLASRCFEKALALEPLLPEANYNLSICLHNQGKLKEAENYCKKAILQDATNSDFQLHLGVIYYDRGQFENAAIAFLKSLEVQQKHQKGRTKVDAYWQLFSLHLSQHRYQDAIQTADLGIQSQQLSDEQLCSLLIGKTIIFFLFNHLEEAKQALQLSEIIHHFPAPSKHIKNIGVFHTYIKNLIALEDSGVYRDCYTANDEMKDIYFVSESHGFAPNRTTINYKNENYRVKSLFIMGAKVIHFVKEEENKYQVSLVSLLRDLPRGSKVVIGFGEIDCRPDEGIYPYSLKSQRDYKTVINDMLTKYIEALRSIADSFEIEIILYGVPAPHPQSIETLDEPKQQGFIDIIDYYNQVLREICRGQKMTLLDVYSLTNAAGKSNLQYHIDDHHLSPKTVPILFSNLNNS